MFAIELPAEIDQNQQIHLQLPKHIIARKAKVIVIYEETKLTLKPIQLGLFKGKIHLNADFNEPLPDSFWLGVCRTSPIPAKISVPPIAI